MWIWRTDLLGLESSMSSFPIAFSGTARSSSTVAFFVVTLGIFSAVELAHAQELAIEPEQAHKEYSPYLDRGYPQRVFWGDTHLHTSYSTDAGMLGNRLGPEEAIAEAAFITKVVCCRSPRSRRKMLMSFWTAWSLRSSCIALSSEGSISCMRASSARQ